MHSNYAHLATSKNSVNKDILQQQQQQQQRLQSESSTKPPDPDSVFSVPGMWGVQSDREYPTTAQMIIDSRARGLNRTQSASHFKEHVEAVKKASQREDDTFKATAATVAKPCWHRGGFCKSDPQQGTL